MLSLDLTGAEVLGAQGLHRDGLSFSGGLIVDAPVGRAVDLTGYLVLPGIVDVHGDGFERHLAPRRGAMKQMSEGLVAVEAELAANGITTATLAQFVSWEGGVRSLEFAEQVFSHLRDVAPGMVTDLRGQLRFETYQLDLFETLPAKMAEWGLRYVVFNDHLPHDRLQAGQQPRRLVSQALKARRSPEKHLALMHAMEARSEEVPAALDMLCRKLAEQGIAQQLRAAMGEPTRRGQLFHWRRENSRVGEIDLVVECQGRIVHDLTRKARPLAFRHVGQIRDDAIELPLDGRE